MLLVNMVKFDFFVSILNCYGSLKSKLDLFVLNVLNCIYVLIIVVFIVWGNLFFKLYFGRGWCFVYVIFLVVWSLVIFKCNSREKFGY